MTTVAPTNSQDKPVAHRLDHDTRRHLALQALGSSSISALARQNETSRKFIRSLRDKAKEAVRDAFSAASDDSEVLFYLPVTKAWLAQLTVVLLLVCKASYRAVIEVFATCLDTRTSLGSIHRLVQSTSARVQELHGEEPLELIKEGAHDEIFRGRTPVLTGCDIRSGYCYLLNEQPQCDGDTWALTLWELEERGLALDYAVADFGKGLRAGHRIAWPKLDLWADHFHVLKPFGELVRFLKRRCERAQSSLKNVEGKMSRAKAKGLGQKYSRELGYKREVARSSAELHCEVGILYQWAKEVLQPAGYELSVRRQLWSFITWELAHRKVLCSHRIGPVLSLLQEQTEPIFSFAERLEERLLKLASEHQVSAELVFEMAATEAQSDGTSYWKAALRHRKQLGERYWGLHQGLLATLKKCRRASSEVENLNGRLRPYIELRRRLGERFEELLRWFLNHHRQVRSRRDDGAGKSPAERLVGETLPHWLEQLGYTPFTRTP